MFDVAIEADSLELLNVKPELESRAIPPHRRPILRWWLRRSLRRDLRQRRTLIVTAP